MLNELVLEDLVRVLGFLYERGLCVVERHTGAISSSCGARVKKRGHGSGRFATHPRPFTMGKSIRSKAKRTHRRTKRETGVFAAQDAARLQRLSAKLAARLDADPEPIDGNEAGRCSDLDDPFLALGVVDQDDLTHCCSLPGRAGLPSEFWRALERAALQPPSPSPSFILDKHADSSDNRGEW